MAGVEVSEGQLGVIKSVLSLFGDGMTASHLGGHFTCFEAELIADAMLAVGLDDELVAVWLDCHGDADDDPEDMHYRGEEE